MKGIKSFVLIFFLICLLQCSLLTASAKSDFITEPENDRTPFLIERISKQISPLSSAPAKEYIQCFDVNEEGQVVIASGIFNSNKIIVYSSDGEYLYGFDYSSYGTYSVGWNGKNVLIYDVRGNLVIEVAQNGEVLNVLKIKNTEDVHKRWKYVQSAKRKTVGSDIYTLKKNTELTLTDENGNQTIIYKVSSAGITKRFILLSLIIGFIVFWIIAFTKMIITRIKHTPPHNKKSQNQP